MVVCIADTVVALMAGCAIFPAVFALGHEPTGGTALLFGTLQGVFNEMGAVGPVIGRDDVPAGSDSRDHIARLPL